MKNHNQEQVSNSKSHKFYTGVVWYFCSNLFPALSSLLIFSLASRIITPHELGVVTLASTVTIILSSFCAVGFGEALIQFKNINKKHLSTVYFICLILSSIIYIASVLFVELYDLKQINGLFKEVYPVIATKIIIDSCALIPLSYLTRTMEFKAIAIRTMYSSIASILLCIPVLYLGGGVWAIVLSQIITSIISFVILTMSARLNIRISFDKVSFQDLKKFGITSTLTKIVTSISVDNVIIGFYGSVVTLGIYAFSRRVFGSIADILNNAIASVTYPLYASVQDEKEELRKVFFKTTFFSTLLSLPAFTGLILISPHLIPLVFGEQWMTAIPVIQVYCIIGFISCIGSIQMSLIKGLGKTSWILKYQLFQQISTAILVFIFAKDGAFVLIAVIAIKTYCIWPYTVIYISKLLSAKVSSYLMNFIKPIISSLVMYLLCYFIDTFCDGLSLSSRIVILILAGLSIYTLVIAILAKKEILATYKTMRKRS